MRRVLHCPGNTYGEDWHPTDIVKDLGNKGKRKQECIWPEIPNIPETISESKTLLLAPSTENQSNNIKNDDLACLCHEGEV